MPPYDPLQTCLCPAWASEHCFLKFLSWESKAVPEEGAHRMKILRHAIELENEFCSLTAHHVQSAVCIVILSLGAASFGIRTHQPHCELLGGESPEVSISGLLGQPSGGHTWLSLLDFDLVSTQFLTCQ